jgi:hypothetical protein
MFRRLRPVFREVDSVVTELLGIEIDVDALWNQAWEMMERRVKGTERVARPGAHPWLRRNRVGVVGGVGGVVGRHQ